MSSISGVSAITSNGAFYHEVVLPQQEQTDELNKELQQAAPAEAPAADQ